MSEANAGRNLLVARWLALGAAAGAQAFALFGWSGISVLGAACGVLALAMEYFARR